MAKAKARKVKVERIEISVSDIKLSLTPKEARALFDELKEIVGDKETVTRWWYTYPNTVPEYLQPPFKFTCDTGTVTTANTEGDNWVSSSTTAIDGPVRAYLAN